MLLKEKIQMVIVSVAITLAIAAAIYQAVIKPKLNIFAPGDQDAPIMMAGGSLSLGSDNVNLVPATNGSGNPILKTDQMLNVFRINLSDPGGAQPLDVPANTSGTVEVEYCEKNPCQAAPNSDLVTVTFAPGTAIEISNTLNNLQLARRLLLNLRMHRKKNWLMNKVTVKLNGTILGRAAICGDQSDCTVIIHSCYAGHTCTPMN